MYKKYFFVFYLFLLNFAKIGCFAQNIDKSENLENVLKTTNYEPNYFSLFFGLFLVVGLVYLTGFLYQKLTKIKLEKREENVLNKIDIISTAHLGQNKALHVIKINNEYSLIGVCQNNIAYLKDLKYPKEDYEKDG